MLNWKHLSLTFVIGSFCLSNPALARFIANDPVNSQEHLKEGNVQGFNRYAYANNNPYKYVDPDGRKIKIVGTPNYTQQVTGDLSRIKSANPVLNNMVTNLEKSSHTHLIQMPSPGRGNSNRTTGIIANESKAGVGTSSTTSYNPNNHFTAQGKRDPAVGLTHELTHASDKDQGKMDRTPNPKTGTKKSEERAMAKENLMRKKTGDPQRTKY
jgi:hypothetical protein